ncbi:MAG: HAD family phosphatase [Oscillospiraceae bacterium]|nr:HAD family phosphatase [Oscillospiraceae bacterium]
MIKAVIFDMDGLMLDTERLTVKAWDQIGEDLGVGPFGYMVPPLIGRNRAANQAFMQDQFHGNPSFETILELKEEYFRKYFAEHGIPVKEGLFDLLKWLKEADIRTSVATSTVEETAREELTETGILPYFDKMVCGNMVKNGKPAPDIFLLAAEKLGVAPENCMVLEDSPSGIRAAFAAGMHPVMVPDLVQPDEEITAMLTRKVDSLSCVRAVIEELNR